MRRLLMIGGLLMAGVGPLAEPVLAQQRRPPAPPRAANGLPPGPAELADSLRLGTLSALQPALGTPVFYAADSVSGAIGLANQMTLDQYMASAEYIYDPDVDVKAKRRHARMLLVLRKAWARRYRILNHPNEVDLVRGDAPNALLEVLSDPRIPPSSLRRYGQEIPGETIQRLSFHYKAGTSPVSLGRLTVRDGWPLPLRGAEFELERRAYRAAIEAALEQNLAGNLAPEAFGDVQRAVVSLRRKLDAAGSSLQRADYALARDFLERLNLAVEAMREPNVERALAAIDSYSGTNVGDLIVFMQDYNLRFAPATNPDERKLYHQLYPAMRRLRDVVVPAVDAAKGPSNPGATPEDEPVAGRVPPAFDGDAPRAAPPPRRPAGPAPPRKERSRLGDR